MNPLDYLLMYGSNYEFGTDDAKKIEVEFNVNVNTLLEAKQKMNSTEYNLLLQDYIYSVCICIARDMFALLPIRTQYYHSHCFEWKNRSIIDFDRQNFSNVKFGYINPSDSLVQFRHNMNFNETCGFSPVGNLE